YPLVCCMRPIVRIGNEIRTARIKSADLGSRALQGHVRTVIDSERSSRCEVCNRIHLPPREQRFGKRRSACCEWNLIAAAKDKPVARIEERRAVLRLQVEGILRQIVLARNQSRCGARNVERRDIVEGLRIGIRTKKRKTVIEAARERQLSGMICGV